MNKIASKCIVEFYRIWHGKLRLKGAGRLISYLAPRMPGLQQFPLRLPNGRIANVDFRELSAFGWLNAMLGDDYQETPLINSLCRHLGQQSVFWDIGANAGVVSYKISQILTPQEHHYFEPNPKLYQWAAVAMGHLDNTTGHQIAISDECGNATLYIPRNRSAYGSLNKSDAAEVDEVHVELTTCDSLVFEKGFLAPHVIKIDTEGHEVKVLAGMKRLIQVHRPVIFFEHIDITDAEIDSMTPTGYLLKTVSNTSGDLTRAFEREAGHNSVFLPLPV